MRRPVQLGLPISLLGHQSDSSGQDKRGAVSYDITLERRIRELCAEAVAARDTDEVHPILSELREALRQHAEHLKSMVAEYPFSPVDVDKVVQLSSRVPGADIKKRKAV